MGDVTPQLNIEVDPLGSGVPVFSAGRDVFDDTAVTPSGNHLQNYTFTTPSLLGPSTLRLERTAFSQNSDSSGIAFPSSTVTRGIKET